MGLLWNGDLTTGDRSQYGAVEFGGTFDGSPSLGERVIVGPSVDGKQPRHPAAAIMKTLVRSGDRYGSSSGERTLLRQHEPIRSRGNGYDSAIAMSVMFPDEYPFGNLDAWGLIEWHGASPYPSLVNLRPLATSLICEVNSTTGSVSRKPYTVIESIKKGVWYDIVLRVRHALAGAVEVWVREAGQPFARVVNLPVVPTCLNSNYLLVGFYGAAQGFDRWVLHGGAREYDTVQEAIDWLDSLTPSPEPAPPDPEPEPPPVPVDPCASVRLELAAERLRSVGLADDLDAAQDALSAEIVKVGQIRDELRLEIAELRKTLSWAKVKARPVWKAYLLAGGK